MISVDGQLFHAPYYDGIAPDTSGIVWFNISGFVDQPVNTVFQYPPAGPFVEYPSLTKKVKIQVAESYVDSDGYLHDPFQEGSFATAWGSESTMFQILKGGVSDRQIAMWEEASTNFFNVYLQSGKFLTHRPWGDFVHPKQPIKLWFIPVSSLSATYKIRYFFDDGTENTYTTPVSLSDESMYEFNCNPYHLGVNIEPAGKRVEFFDVSLENGGVEISDLRRFTYDWNYCERPFFLLFANSIGGVDDIYLSGFTQEKFSTEGTMAVKVRQRGDKVHAPQLVTPSIFGQNKFTINTGFKTPTQMRLIRDMLVSRQKWLLYPNLGVSNYIVIPVNIENGDMLLVDHRENWGNLDNIDLQLSEAAKSQYSFDNRLY